MTPNQGEGFPCWSLNRILRNTEQERKQADQSTRRRILENCNIKQARENWTFIPCKKIAFLLTFIGPCIANIFAKYNQQDATFHNFFISVRRSKCFRRVFRPSSGAQNCTYSVRYLSDQYCYLPLYVQFWAPDDGRKTRLKHLERLTETKKVWNVVTC